MTAPDMFRYDANNHCFVKRQAMSKADVDRMIRVAFQAEAQCIRYRGNDAAILRRLAELKLSAISDTPVPENILPIVRNRATFETTVGNAQETPALLAACLRFFLVRMNSARRALGDKYATKFRRVSETLDRASFDFSWVENQFHSIQLSRENLHEAKWVICHNSAQQVVGVGVSILIHDWLLSETELNHVRWYAERDGRYAGDWSETPW
jgi:hypothetical protein